MPDLKIAVIGAGIGGLVSAAALQKQGHRVQVYEASPTVRTTGAGISLFKNALDALSAIDLLSIIGETSQAISLENAGQRLPDGKWLIKLPEETTKNFVVLPRVDLHRQLMQRLLSGTVKTGNEALVESAEQGILMITDENGTVRNEQFDLIIAADGIRSQARKSMGLDTGLRYAGYTAWRGMTEHDFSYTDAGATWGFGEHFGYSHMLNGKTYWFATATVPEASIFRGERAELKRRFKRWHSPIAEIIADSPDQSLMRHDIYALARPLKTFVSGRTILLGDAAHAMTPDLGQGACQAIEDAATIAKLLGKASDTISVQLAVSRYDRIRRPRSQRIAKRAWLLGKLAQTQNGALHAVRNLGMRLTPAFVFRAMLNSIHNYKALK